MVACEKAAISRRLLLWKLYFFIFWHFSLLHSQAGHLDKRQKEKKNRKRENINRSPNTENDPILTTTGQCSRQQIIS